MTPTCTTSFDRRFLTRSCTVRLQTTPCRTWPKTSVGCVDLRQSSVLLDRRDMCAACCAWQVSASYYALSPRKDVCFELGRLLMSLKVRCAARPVVTSQQPSVATSVMSTECHPSQRHGEACQFFESSNAFCGEHHVTWHNLGICCFYVDNLPAALDCFSRVRHIRFRARARGVRFSLRPCVRQSMELDPHYADARTWYRKVRARLWRSQHPPSSP